MWLGCSFLRRSTLISFYAEASKASAIFLISTAVGWQQKASSSAFTADGSCRIILDSESVSFSVLSPRLSAYHRQLLLDQILCLILVLPLMQTCSCPVNHLSCKLVRPHRTRWDGVETDGRESCQALISVDWIKACAVGGDEQDREF